MKKVFLLVVLVAFLSRGFAQSADEVINKFLAASGGKEKLKGIKTLQYKQTISVNTPMGDFEIPMRVYKEKNKLFRMETSMEFGGQTLDFFTLVTDTAGYIMLPAMPMLGSDGGIQRMDEKDRVAQTFQTDPAGLFAGLIDYSAKGNTVQLLPPQKIENEDCYQLKLIMANGDEITHFISKATNLVIRTDTKASGAANMAGLGALMGGKNDEAQKTEVTTLYSDYTDLHGLKLPVKSVIKNQLGDAVSMLSDIRVDEAIDPKFYKAEKLASL